MPNYKIQKIYRLLPQPPKNLTSHVCEQLFLKKQIIWRANKSYELYNFTALKYWL